MYIVACTQDRSDLMAVTTIKLDEFLPKKLDGEVVTAEDWNKLVALFQAINSNAFELLDVRKAVEVNTGNIAEITQGAVPDNSITSAKLSKSGSVTQVYQLTTDLTPVSGVTYYVRNETGQYVPAVGLVTFDPDTQYFNLNTVACEPAVNVPEIVGTNVIKNDHMQSNTLLANVCTDLFLGGLLADKVTIYTDRGVSGTFDKSVDTSGATHTHTITLDKSHKALVIINEYTISFITDYNANTPDLYIGLNNTLGTTQPALLRIARLSGENKHNVSPQDTANGANFTGTVAGSPYNLCGGNYRVRLKQAYYNSSEKQINLTTELIYTGKGDNSFNYSFGDYIIGL